MRKFHLIVAVALIAGLVISSQALAFRGGGRPHKGFAFLALSEKLGLSDEQKSEIESIKLKAEKAAIPREAELKSARLDLRELLKADKVDRAAVRRKLEEISKLRVELKMIRINSMLDAKAVLTPEQLKKLKEIRKEAAERRIKLMRERFRERRPIRERPPVKR